MRIPLVIGAVLVTLFAGLPVYALEVSTRPGDAVLGGSAGFSNVRLDKDEDRVQSVQIGFRGAYFVAERWAIGAGVIFDRVDQENTNITTQRYLAELHLVPVPDAKVSPFIRIGGGFSSWKWDPGTVDSARQDAYTAEGSAGFFAFFNDYFALAVDATYFYDQYKDNPNNDDDSNVSVTIGFVGFLR